jgi:hypothetical protein
MPDGISLPYNGTGAAQVLLSHFEPTLEQCTPAISSVNRCRTTGCWTTDGTDPTINWGCKEIGIDIIINGPKTSKSFLHYDNLLKCSGTPSEVTWGCRLLSIPRSMV